MHKSFHFLSIAALVLVTGCTQIRHFGEMLGGKNALWAPKRWRTPIFLMSAGKASISWSITATESILRIPHDTSRSGRTTPTIPSALQPSAPLNCARDKSATPVFIQALHDSNPLVRLEAAKALANIPDAAAMEPLKTLVADPTEDRDVRIAAAHALRFYRNLDVARALVSVLNGREFGVAWQARHSLVTLTGKDLHYDESAWLKYLTSPSSPMG